MKTIRSAGSGILKAGIAICVLLVGWGAAALAAPANEPTSAPKP
jgi:hypothetical protein